MTNLPQRDFAAFLFDMDGTVLDSIAVANRVWSRWAESHGLDPAPILAVMHGVQAVQTIRRFAPPGVDVLAETAALTQAEIEEAEGTLPIPGAPAFLAALPADRWAIVTSAPRALALRRLAVAGIPMPSLLISADDVAHGKPAPDCFLLAAERLGFAASDCLVWEDAPAGIAAGEAAGATVMVVTTTHHAPIETGHATIASYEPLAVEIGADGRLSLSA
ncbi:HAD-IA family hydrolase [Sphingomonas abietis]|uniref:HAD-IA family hydrolase n=1 Tax=Sphingomonas abietis TaxID=3012344 RepID=A0ABY7NRY0_9SPHN|nr:HAD-IA family hydrolase [Sphingomonas abietis]WBO24248.1 HAD-IA family hydrolase [Sphingomonas abietis]